jgi:protein-tyrosine kinase
LYRRVEDQGYSMSENEKTAGKEEREREPSSFFNQIRGPRDAARFAGGLPAQVMWAGDEKLKKAVTPVRITSPYIIRFTEEDGHLAEEYRKLKSMVLARMPKNANQNTLMVASSESGEGKSLTAVNLALVLAQESNRTVLLVDADLRRPTLHTYLGVKPSVGLADCIVDGIDLHDALIKTSVPRLNFLAAGKETDTPAELLSSDKMKAIVQEIKNRYHDRIIIFDTPPALVFSDIRVLSMFADGIIFVVKEGVAVNSVRDALSALKGSPLLGIVYNGASPEQLNGRYHRYYHYYHRQPYGNHT